jgi:hypothetical protein
MNIRLSPEEINETSISLICLSYSFFFISRFVEIDITDGNSVTFGSLGFFDVIVGSGADDDRDDLLIAANKPPRVGV